MPARCSRAGWPEAFRARSSALRSSGADSWEIVAASSPSTACAGPSTVLTAEAPAPAAISARRSKRSSGSAHRTTSAVLAIARLARLLGQSVEHARLHHRIVVEEHEHVAACSRGARIATAPEVAVTVECDDRGSVTPRVEERRCVVRRCVVDEHELHCVADAVTHRLLDALQASLCDWLPSEGDDYDREARCLHDQRPSAMTNLRDTAATSASLAVSWPSSAHLCRSAASAIQKSAAFPRPPRV